MHDENLHNDIVETPVGPEDVEFWKQVAPPFKRKKEDIWATLEKKIEEKPILTEAKEVTLSWTRLVAAAVVLLAVSTFFFARYYTVTVECNHGDRLTYELPDGSQVYLNAGSSISCTPYWWSIDRQVELSGEAFFEVKKGEKFTVYSALGHTQVLGTSFNIYTRNDKYEVFCKTGKVKVEMADVDEVFVLRPHEMVLRNKSGGKKIVGIHAEDVIGWRENKFNFTSIPLTEVVEELERQYDVKIQLAEKKIEELAYTGFFQKTETLDSTLDLVCLSFDLKFERISDNQYKISHSK